MINGKQDGFASYEFPDGEKYVGEWREDGMDGRGIYVYADCRRLDGSWQDNRFVAKSGEDTGSH